MVFVLQERVDMGEEKRVVCKIFTWGWVSGEEWSGLVWLRIIWHSV